MGRLSGPAKGSSLTRSSVEHQEQEDPAGQDLCSSRRKWRILSVLMLSWILPRRQVRGATMMQTGGKTTGMWVEVEETGRGGRIMTKSETNNHNITIHIVVESTTLYNYIFSVNQINNSFNMVKIQ